MKKRLFLEALQNNMGNISEACKKANVGRTTYYDWLKADKRFAETVNDLQESLLDLAETRVHELLDDGHPATCRWFLETKGKDRGYTKRQELEGKVESIDWKYRLNKKLIEDGLEPLGGKLESNNQIESNRFKKITKLIEEVGFEENQTGKL